MHIFDRYLKIVYYTVFVINLFMGLMEIVVVALTKRNNSDCYKYLYDVILTCGVGHIIFFLSDFITGILKTRCLTTRRHTYMQVFGLIIPILGATLYYGINNKQCIDPSYKSLYTLTFVESILMLFGGFLFILTLVFYFIDRRIKANNRNNTPMFLTLSLPPLPPLKIVVVPSDGNTINRSP